MFRFWLGITSAVSVSCVLALSIALYWISSSVNQNVAAHQHASLAYERYEQLAHESYRYFKAEFERLSIDENHPYRPEPSDRERLLEALENLKRSALSHTPGKQDDQAELQRIAQITVFINGSFYTFHDAGACVGSGKFEQAHEMLAKFSSEDIDHQFQPMLDGALKAHRDTARKTQAAVDRLLERSRWLALLAGIFSTCISLYGAIYLYTRLGRTIRALMRGTSEIARGNLDARIQLNGKDEFSILARHFNRMAEQLRSHQLSLIEQRDSLETRVEERTQELLDLNQNLRRMDHDRRDFLADVSHELRTPITVIRGEAEIMLRSNDTTLEDYRQTLHRIVDLSAQLGDHVGDLLAAARAESTSVNDVSEPTDLRDLLSHIHDDLRILASDRHIDVRLVLPDRPAWVVADANRLRQAIVILGDNACRYSNDGGEIVLSLRIDGDRALISVDDQGIGIAPDEMAHIFERRFRGKEARVRRPDGVGLGLSMVQSIVRTLDGSVHVSSEIHQGSHFTVDLPLIDVDLPTR